MPVCNFVPVFARVPAVAYEVTPGALKLVKLDGITGKSDPFFEVRCTPPGMTYEIISKLGPHHERHHG